MDIQKEREAFESWWEGFHNGRQIACDYVEEDNSYSVGYANAQWVAWQAKAQAVPECTWSRNEDYYFDTSCGNNFMFTECEDKPSTHQFKHCCYCGGKLIEALEPTNDRNPKNKHPVCSVADRQHDGTR